MHAATPILSVLVIASLVLAPPFLFETAFPPSHPPLLPHPIPSVLFAASVWSLKHLIRIPLFSSFEYAGLPSWAAPAVHAVLSDVLRFFSVPLLFSLSCSIPHDDAGLDALCHHAPSSRDPAFALAWFFALGWSATETSYAVYQTYEQLALYRDVLVPPPFLAGPDEALYPREEVEAGSSAVPRDYAEERRRSGMLTASPGGMADITEEMLEEELERLARVKARQELEEVYGMPIVVSLPISALVSNAKLKVCSSTSQCSSRPSSASPRSSSRSASSCFSLPRTCARRCPRTRRPAASRRRTRCCTSRSRSPPRCTPRSPSSTRRPSSLRSASTRPRTRA
jgi:hypothetical protein